MVVGSALTISFLVYRRGLHVSDLDSPALAVLVGSVVCRLALVPPAACAMRTRSVQWRGRNEKANVFLHQLAQRSLDHPTSRASFLRLRCPHRISNAVNG